MGSRKKLLHLRLDGIVQAYLLGLLREYLSLLSWHGVDRLSNAYLPATTIPGMTANAGFNLHHKEKYIIPWAYLRIDEKQLVVWTAQLFPQWDNYKRQVVEKAKKNGSKSQLSLGERRFVHELIPMLAVVLLQNGLYMTQQYPDHEWSKVLLSIEGYRTWVRHATPVFKVIEFIYKHGFEGYYDRGENVTGEILFKAATHQRQDTPLPHDPEIVICLEKSLAPSNLAMPKVLSKHFNRILGGFRTGTRVTAAEGTFQKCWDGCSSNSDSAEGTYTKCSDGCSSSSDSTNTDTTTIQTASRKEVESFEQSKDIHKPSGSPSVKEWEEDSDCESGKQVDRREEKRSVGTFYEMPNVFPKKFSAYVEEHFQYDILGCDKTLKDFISKEKEEKKNRGANYKRQNGEALLFQWKEAQSKAFRRRMNLWTNVILVVACKHDVSKREAMKIANLIDSKIAITPSEYEQKFIRKGTPKGRNAKKVNIEQKKEKERLVEEAESNLRALQSKFIMDRNNVGVSAKKRKRL
jgi:hypothetical protein